MLDQRLTLNCKYGGAGCRNGCAWIILSWKDITGRLAHIGTQFDQRLDQNSRLYRHMQRSGNLRAFERFAIAIFFAQRNQSGHFGFGNV